MNPNHANDVMAAFEEAMSECFARLDRYLLNPEKDFTRDRKLTLRDTVLFTMIMGSGSLEREIWKHFKHLPNTPPSKSAYVKRRKKILPILYRDILYEFNKRLENLRKFRDYRLYAVDGSSLNVAHNPNSSSYIYNPRGKGYNQLHLSTIYDLINKMYINVHIENKNGIDERATLITMLDSMNIDEKSIIVADMGYESYNMIEYLNRKEGLDYVVRVRQGNSACKFLKDQPMARFDEMTSVSITTSRKKDDIANKRIWTLKNKWRYESPCTITFRTVRFLINDKVGPDGTVENNPENYETIVTSLNQEEFTTEDIKELYNMRWGIETSYCHLKHAEGLEKLHAKNEDSVLQEIYGRLVMYNFTSRITNQTEIQQKDENAYEYQPNFTMAVGFCREFIAGEIDSDALIERIRMHTEPVRPGRKRERDVKPRQFPGFGYRDAA